MEDATGVPGTNDLCCPYAIGHSMPPFPPGLSEWLQQGLPTGVVGLLLWYAVTTQAKRIDELRADMKEGFAQCRADNKALADKLDRLVESLLAAKQL